MLSWQTKQTLHVTCLSGSYLCCVFVKNAYALGHVTSYLGVQIICLYTAILGLVLKILGEFGRGDVFVPILVHFYVAGSVC